MIGTTVTSLRLENWIEKNFLQQQNYETRSKALPCFAPHRSKADAAAGIVISERKIQTLFFSVFF